MPSRRLKVSATRKKRSLPRLLGSYGQLACLLNAVPLRIAVQPSTHAPPAQGAHTAANPAGQVGGSTQQAPCGVAVQLLAGTSSAHDAPGPGQSTGAAQVVAEVHSPSAFAATPWSRRRQSFQ